MVANPNRWLWLFPLTYAVHIAEEGLAGERFYRWIKRVPLVRALDLEISGRQFVIFNAVYLLGMVVAVIVAPLPGYGWVAPALGILVAVNGFGHLVGSVVTRSYSPGLISGLLLWVPLGLFAIAAGHRTLPQSSFWISVAVGILAQAAVAIMALLFFKRRRLNQQR